MDAAKQNLISDISYLARVLFAEYGRIAADDILWTDWGDEITQEDIDSVPSFLAAELTKAEIAAAIYIIKMCKVQMDSDLPSFVKLARL